MAAISTLGRAARGAVLATVLAAVVVGGASGAGADERQVSKFLYEQPAGAKILVCPETLAPADCDASSALAVIAGPPNAKDMGCGVQSPEVLAGSGLAIRGQYVKGDCVRRQRRRIEEQAR